MLICIICTNQCSAAMCTCTYQLLLIIERRYSPNITQLYCWDTPTSPIHSWNHDSTAISGQLDGTPSVHGKNTNIDDWYIITHKVWYAAWRNLSIRPPHSIHEVRQRLIGALVLSMAMQIADHESSWTGGIVDGLGSLLSQSLYIIINTPIASSLLIILVWLLLSLLHGWCL